MMGFDVIDLDAEDQRALSLWARTDSRDPYSHPSYLRVLAGQHGRAFVAVYESSSTVSVLPFRVVRGSVAEASVLDVVGPYGGGAGCIGNSHEGRSLIEGFTEWANEHKATTAFWLALDHELPADLGSIPGLRVRRRGQAIAMDLTREDEARWSDYKHKVRKNVKRARAENVTIEIVRGLALWDQFLPTYAETMNRRAAADNFDLSRSDFDALEAMADCCVIAIASMQGRVVSTELALVGARRIYSYLGGTRADSFSSRPNDLLKHELANWASSEGYDEYFLGGGHAEGDGIFRYKEAFAPTGARDVISLEVVLCADSYRAATATLNVAGMSSEYFPAYRAPGAGYKVEPEVG